MLEKYFVTARFKVESGETVKFGFEQSPKRVQPRK